MYAIVGWTLGVVLAISLVFLFGIKDPLVGVLIGFFLSMCGIIIGGGYTPGGR